MKINIPFTIEKSQDENPYYTVFGFNVGGYYATDIKAKKEIRKKLNKEIAEAQKLKENQKSVYIFCNDGTVLRVGYYSDSWGCEISRPNQGNKGWTFGHEQTFTECLESAKEYAKTSFDGIINICY